MVQDVVMSTELEPGRGNMEGIRIKQNVHKKKTFLTQNSLIITLSPNPNSTPMYTSIDVHRFYSKS